MYGGSEAEHLLTRRKLVSKPMNNAESPDDNTIC
jgi:hypothetical protein